MIYVIKNQLIKKIKFISCVDIISHELTIS